VEEADESAVDADFIAFGSPAVGAEEIAPEMVEFFEGIKDKIIGKTVGLFGSYDWGQGGWMETWREEIINEGLSVVNDGLIIHLAVDDDEKIEKEDPYFVHLKINLENMLRNIQQKRIKMLMKLQNLFMIK